MALQNITRRPVYLLQNQAVNIAWNAGGNTETARLTGGERCTVEVYSETDNFDGATVTIHQVIGAEAAELPLGSFTAAGRLVVEKGRHPLKIKASVAGVVTASDITVRVSP